MASSYYIDPRPERGSLQIAVLLCILLTAAVPGRRVLAQESDNLGRAFNAETANRTAEYKHTADQLIEGFNTNKLPWCDDRGQLRLLGTGWQYKIPATIDDMTWMVNNANADVSSISDQIARRTLDAGNYFASACQSNYLSGTDHACEHGAVNQYVQAALTAEMSELKLQRINVIVAGYKYSMCFSFNTPAADQMQREIQRTLHSYLDGTHMQAECLENMSRQVADSVDNPTPCK